MVNDESPYPEFLRHLAYSIGAGIAVAMFSFLAGFIYYYWSNS